MLRQFPSVLELVSANKPLSYFHENRCIKFLTKLVEKACHENRCIKFLTKLVEKACHGNRCIKFLTKLVEKACHENRCIKFLTKLVEKACHENRRYDSDTFYVRAKINFFTLICIVVDRFGRNAVKNISTQCS